MKVKNVYDRLFNSICRVVNYYNGTDYGFLVENTDKKYLLDMEVVKVSADFVNGNEPCIVLMVDDE